MTNFTLEQKAAIEKALGYRTGWITDKIKEAVNELLRSEKIEMADTNKITGLVLDLVYTRDIKTGNFKHSYESMAEKSSELYKILRKYSTIYV